jgi:hypothetical protein
MNRFSRKIIAGIILTSALMGGQAQAEIKTVATDQVYNTFPPSAFEEFSGSTPCALSWKKESPMTSAVFVKTFKDSGFNITTDTKAHCSIFIHGYITGPSNGSGSVPVDLIYAIDNKDYFGEIGPALKSTENTEAGNVTKNASGMNADPIDGSGLGALSQAGGALNGFHGSVAGTLLGSVADIVSGIHSRIKTPAGVVYVEATLSFDTWIPGITRPALILGAYAASTTPEKPEALIDAAIKRLAQSIWEHTAAYDKEHGIAFTMPTYNATADQPDTNTSSANTAGQNIIPVAGTIASSASSATPNDAGKAVADTAQTADNGNASKMMGAQR